LIFTQLIFLDAHLFTVIVQADYHVSLGCRALPCAHRNEDRNRMDSRAYRLSRVYGQGWKAAKEMLLDRTEDLHAKSTGPENPHDTVEDRVRWGQGFEDALHSVSNQRVSDVRFWGSSRKVGGCKPPRDVKR
jgi:hypothetical protein